MTENSGGDRLASGASKFQFRPMGGNLTQEAWDRLWEDDKPEQRSSDADAPSTGDVGTVPGTNQSGQ